MELKPDALELVAGLERYMTWPFSGEIGIRELAPLADEEPERAGTDPANCRTCHRDDSDFIWTDDRWRLGPLGEGPFPGSLMLFPRDHVSDLTELPIETLASFGLVLARIERALMRIGEPGSPDRRP